MGLSRWFSRKLKELKSRKQREGEGTSLSATNSPSRSSGNLWLSFSFWVLTLSWFLLINSACMYCLLSLSALLSDSFSFYLVLFYFQRVHYVFCWPFRWLMKGDSWIFPVSWLSGVLHTSGTTFFEKIGRYHHFSCFLVLFLDASFWILGDEIQLFKWLLVIMICVYIF